MAFIVAVSATIVGALGPTRTTCRRDSCAGCVCLPGLPLGSAPL